jgi:hypothetical protein
MSTGTILLAATVVSVVAKATTTITTNLFELYLRHSRWKIQFR